MKVIIVTGVSGVGKSVLASRLSRRLGGHVVNLSVLVLTNGLWSEYDRLRRSFVIDYEKLVKRLKDIVKQKSRGAIIIDTHWVEPFIDAGLDPDIVLLLRCNPLELIRRLERRFWPKRKIAENVEAELVGTLVSELSELNLLAKVYEIDTTSKNIDITSLEAIKAINDGKSKCCIDWLSSLSENELLKVISYIERHLG